MTKTIPGTRKRQELQKPANGEPMVVVNQLVKQFGKLRAIDNLTLNITCRGDIWLDWPQWFWQDNTHSYVSGTYSSHKWHHPHHE